MKNQYVGDIGDYGKYSLLSAFIDAGINVGVNWYLTKEDGSSDGGFTDYLKKEDMRKYSPLIFDALSLIAYKNNKCIADIENSGILPGALFYSELFSPEGKKEERLQKREKWFKRSKGILSKAELVFMDPDNGLLVSSDVGKRGTEKYILSNEIEDYFNDGHDVVYYCHKGRRTLDKWQSYKDMMGEIIGDARTIVLTYHKGTQRSYVFLVHDEHYFKYRKIIETLLHKWKGVFNEEYTSRGTFSKNHKFISDVVECSDGSTYEVNKTYKNWKKIYNNVLLYEGFTMNDKACGLGVSYYANGNPLHEGLFGIKGLIEGKEYYPNGQLRCYGHYKINKGYGPNKIINGTWYSEEGKKLYQGDFSVERSGLGWPKVVRPKNFGVSAFNDDGELWLGFSEEYET